MNREEKLINLLMGNGSSDGEILIARNKLKKLLEEEGKWLEITENSINIECLNSEIEKLKRMNISLVFEIDVYKDSYFKTMLELDRAKSKIKSLAIQLNEKEEEIKKIKKGINSAVITIFFTILLVLLIQ